MGSAGSTNGLDNIKNMNILVNGSEGVGMLVNPGELTLTNDYVINFISRFTGNNITTGRDVFYEKAISNFLQSDFKNYLIGKGTASAYLINGTGLHNVFLQILYDNGIFVILIFLSFFVLNLKNAVKKRYFISISMQLVFLIYCMSGNPLYDYYFFIPYLIYVSCNE